MSNETAADLVPIRAVRPPAPYVGGKRALARTIAARLSAQPHRLYAEAFVGLGGVFFRRDFRPPCEVINDLSGDVATLFRVLQRHYRAFLDELKWRLFGRAEFARLSAANPETLTDLERAARFLYLQRGGFGGKVVGRSFGVDYERGSRFNLSRLEPILEDVHERLLGVIIECLPYAEFLGRYDRPGALFYIDPPYVGTEKYYEPGLFSSADHEKLAQALHNLRRPWLLSINDTPEIRRLYADCSIDVVDLHYGIGGGSQAARELLIAPSS